MYTGQKGIALGRELVVRKSPTLGLARLFTIKEGNIFPTEKVQYDIKQKRELMTMPMNRGGGKRRYGGDSFEQVSETPPYINVARPINLGDLKGRASGTTEYDPANEEHVRRLQALMVENYMDLQDIIDRQIEWQASEILQTGKIEFTKFPALPVPVPQKDYDFLMDQVELFVDAGVNWNGATGQQMMDDIGAMADSIRKLGKRQASDVIMGRTARNNFVNSDDVRALLDNRRIGVGEIMPTPLTDAGYSYQGFIIINGLELRIWLYEGRFENPSTGALDLYIDPTNVIVFAETAERDRMHGGIDIVKPTNADMQQLFPGTNLTSVADRVAAVQLPYAYTDEDAATTEIGIATAPLLVPTNRGGHGRINTNP